MNLISKLNLVSPEIKLNGGGVILPSVGEDETSYVVGVNSDGVANVELTDYVKSGSDPLLNSVGTKLINIYPAWGDINNCSAQASISYDEDFNESSSLLINSKGRMYLAADGGAINIRGHLYVSNGISTSDSSFIHGSAEFTNDVSFKNVPTVGSVNLALISDIPDSYTKTESDEKYALTEELESYVSCTTLATTLNDYAKKDELCGYLPICVYSDTAIVESESFSCVALRSYLSVQNGIYIHSGDIVLGETKICGDTGRLTVSYNGSDEEIALTSDIPNIIDNSLVEVFNLGKHVPLEETESKANSITLYGKTTSQAPKHYISASDTPATIEFFTDGYASGSETPMGTYSQKIAAGPYGRIGIIKGSSDHYVYVDPIATSSDLCSFITKDVTELTCFYTKDEVDSNFAKKSEITNVYKYVGSVDNYADLPTTDLVEGYVYNIVNECTTEDIACGDNVAWTGSSWDKLGGTVDLSNYLKFDHNGKVIEKLIIGDGSPSNTEFSLTDLNGEPGLLLWPQNGTNSYFFSQDRYKNDDGNISTNTYIVATLDDIPDISGKSDKATTLAGYGITDAYTKTESDSKYLLLNPGVDNCVQTINSAQITLNNQDCGLSLLSTSAESGIYIGCPDSVEDKVLTSIFLRNDGTSLEFLEYKLGERLYSLSLPKKSGTILTENDIPKTIILTSEDLTLLSSDDNDNIYEYELKEQIDYGGPYFSLPYPVYTTTNPPIVQIFKTSTSSLKYVYGGIDYIQGVFAGNGLPYSSYIGSKLKFTIDNSISISDIKIYLYNINYDCYLGTPKVVAIPI